MKSKAFIGFLVPLFLLAVLLQPAPAKTAITECTCSLEITSPDNIVTNVPECKDIPDIASGSKVEIMGTGSGSMDIAQLEGFIQVVAGNSVATVGTGDKVTVFCDGKPDMAELKVNEGEIAVVSGNTTTTVKALQHAQIRFDEVTGIAEIKSIRGEIETITIGIKALVPEGVTAKISTDASTRTVHVESKGGPVKVSSIGGEITTVADGESTDMPGSVIGEVQTFPAETAVVLPREEPAEPERLEGTKFQP